MTASILAILAAMIPFAIWLYRRQAAKNEDPNVKLEKAKNETDKIIATRDADGLNRHMDAVLRRLQNRSRNSSRQGNGVDGGE